MSEFYYGKHCSRIDEKYDVIVVGGGTAGSTAAIAASMEGARTIVVEKNSYLGGTSTGGQVTPMMHTGIPGNEDCSVINNAIKKRLIKEKYGAVDPYENDGWTNPEMLKFLLEEMLLENGGRILYDTEFIDAVVEDNAVKGIVIHNKSGMQVLEGSAVIDCTGDADVAYAAGVPCFSGCGADGKNQLTSLRFMMGNVDIQKLHCFLKNIDEPVYLDYPMVEIASIWKNESPLRNVFQKAVEDGVLRYEDGEYFQGFSVAGMPGVMSFNCPEIQGVYHSLDQWERSSAIIAGKQAIKRLSLFMKIYLPGFEDSFISSVAHMPGVRESRRIKGEYVLTSRDYYGRARFEDAIARSAYPIDIHGLDVDAGTDNKPLERGEFFEVPFRCLVPVGVNNLLTAGRCISSTFTAQSSVRIQPICRATGEAAGIAAAYCITNKINIKDFDGGIARSIMISHGAAL